MTLMSDSRPAPRVKPAISFAVWRIDVRSAQSFGRVVRSTSCLTDSFFRHHRLILRNEQNGDPRDIAGQQALFLPDLNPRKDGEVRRDVVDLG